jgi:nucleoside-diphosphate-sugar epimerase
MALFTLIGGQGFIGSEIAERLRSLKHLVFVPQKDDDKLFTQNLGTIIYCAGHGDCVGNPSKVFNSNVLLLSQIIEESIFDKIIYLSSTRLYMGQTDSKEQCDLSILNNDDRRLFNLTKLVAEELLLKSKKKLAIIRPSNVYGLALKSPLFLPAITRNAINTGKVDMYVSPAYTKDYVSVCDVAEMTIKIALTELNDQVIYNVASGVNVTAQQIADVLKSETDCDIIWHENETNEVFPETDISLIQQDFGFVPSQVLIDLKTMIDNFKVALA